MPAKPGDGASVPWPKPIFLRLAHAMCPRGQVLLRLADSSVGGSLTTKISGVTGDTFSGSITGEVRLEPEKAEELGPRVPARKQFTVHVVLSGEFVWDRTRVEFRSLQIASRAATLDYKDFDRERYAEQVYEVGIELLPVPPAR